MTPKPPPQSPTPLSWLPVESVPCSTCGKPSIRTVAWPDGQYIAACTTHLDTWPTLSPESVGNQSERPLNE